MSTMLRIAPSRLTYISGWQETARETNGLHIKLQVGDAVGSGFMSALFLSSSSVCLQSYETAADGDGRSARRGQENFGEGAADATQTLFRTKKIQAKQEPSYGA